MRYLSTKIGTSVDRKRSFGERLSTWLLSFISSNPDYEVKLELVRVWLIEFDEEGDPFREIGLDADGVPVLAGPDARNYGFWLDTEMVLKDFVGHEISKDAFELEWRRFFGPPGVEEFK